MTLPEKESFSKEIVDHLFPGNPDKEKIVHLFEHAFDHPWVDEEIQASIVENICNEYNLDIPEEFLDD